MSSWIKWSGSWIETRFKIFTRPSNYPNSIKHSLNPMEAGEEKMHHHLPGHTKDQSWLRTVLGTWTNTISTSGRLIECCDWSVYDLHLKTLQAGFFTQQFTSSCYPSWHWRELVVENWWCAYKNGRGITGQRERVREGERGSGKSSFSWTLNWKMEDPKQNSGRDQLAMLRGFS